MITREFFGKTEEEINEEVLNAIKLNKDQFTINFENEGGFFSFGKKTIKAVVNYEEDFQFGNRCLMFVKDLLERMNIEAKIFLIEESDEKIVIEIESPDSGMIIGKQGKTLESIQTIVNVVMNRSYKNWTKVIIDIGNYRDRREKFISKMAIQYASQVKKSKKSLLLEPMNPFERRIIHMTLKNESNIFTQSEGDGIMKKVRISFKDETANV